MFLPLLELPLPETYHLSYPFVQTLGIDVQTPLVSISMSCALQTRCSDLNPFSGSFNSPFRSGWYDFTDEYNAILEWICGMERLVDAEDAACVTRGELDVAYEVTLT